MVPYILVYIRFFLQIHFRNLRTKDFAWKRRTVSLTVRPQRSAKLFSERRHRNLMSAALRKAHRPYHTVEDVGFPRGSTGSCRTLFHCLLTFLPQMCLSDILWQRLHFSCSFTLCVAPIIVYMNATACWARLLFVSACVGRVTSKLVRGQVNPSTCEVAIFFLLAPVAYFITILVPMSMTWHAPNS